MCMDEDQWNQPAGTEGLRFDNEPGYMGSMLRALTQVVEDDLRGRNTVPTAAGLAQLHATAVGGTFSRHFVEALVATDPRIPEAIDALTAPLPSRQEAVARADETMDSSLP